MGIINTLDLDRYKKHFLIAMLVCFYASEAGTKLAFRFDLGFHNYSALIKGVFAVLILIYSLLVWDSTVKKTTTFLVVIFAVFLLGQYAFSGWAFGENFFKNCIYFSRYVFVFILSMFIFKSRSTMTNKLFYVYEKIVIFNSIMILVGVLFDVALFQTYNTRFGYNGLFMTPSIGTYFYALALTYFSYKYLYEKQKLLELILVGIVCFLVGTKALLLFFALTGVHVFFAKKLYKSKLFYTVALGSVLLFLVFKKTIIGFLVQKFDVLFNVYQDYGLITMLTSLRDKNFQEDFIPLVYEKWHALNFLFGGTDFEVYRVEFEVLDLFLFFGIIGTILYLWHYFTKVLVFKEINTFGKYQMAILSLTALLSGNFFNNAPVVLYLLVVLSFFNMEKHTIENGKI